MCVCVCVCVLCVVCRKKPREVRHKELLEAVSESLVQLARERAVLWAQSKPHSPLLLQIASFVPG